MFHATHEGHVVAVVRVQQGHPKKKQVKRMTFLCKLSHQAGINQYPHLKVRLISFMKI